MDPLPDLDEIFAELDEAAHTYDEELEHDIGRREYLDIALDHLNLFSPWERDFIKSTYSVTSFSPKMRDIVLRIYNRHPELYSSICLKQLSSSNSTFETSPTAPSTPPMKSSSPPPKMRGCQLCRWTLGIDPPY
jgi:hypothetical protein